MTKSAGSYKTSEYFYHNVMPHVKMHLGSSPQLFIDQTQYTLHTVINNNMVIYWYNWFRLFIAHHQTKKRAFQKLPGTIQIHCYKQESN